jgi:uncharacterized membrane protein
MRKGVALRMYAVALVVCFVIDLVWLGLVAKDFYRGQIGHLMRPDVLWAPAVLFYLIYVAALVVFVAKPAVEARSVGAAVRYGAFFGFAAYATFDLTSLALIRDFPLEVAVVDMAWGAGLSATVSGVTVAVERAWP